MHSVCLPVDTSFEPVQVNHVIENAPAVVRTEESPRGTGLHCLAISYMNYAHLIVRVATTD